MDAYSKLMKIAAEMAKKNNMPSYFDDDWDFSKNTTKSDKIKVIKSAEAAHQQCDDWAYEIKKIANTLKNND